jgi:hypothetical protein
LTNDHDGFVLDETTTARWPAASSSDDSTSKTERIVTPTGLIWAASFYGLKWQRVF